MKADLSRNTFNRALHYSAVRLQQGRILTDADWNEQADVTRYRAERLARDTIGPCGAPLDAAGYALIAQTQAFAVHAVDANVALVACEDGALLRTQNGGGAWTLIDSQTSDHLRALQQVGGVGWVVGDGGILRKTSDAGLTWMAQNSGTTRALRGVSVFDANHAWAVGDGGIVIATSDGGANWSHTQTPSARLYGVQFVDLFNGLAVGQSGAIVSTSDGGQTWTGVTSGTTAHFRAIAVFGGSRVWAVGQGGAIVRSVDLGANWLPCNSPSSITLHAIGFRDANEGWALGEGGVVLHSIDSGINWSLEDLGTSATLRGISFFGNEPGWVVGDASTALRIGTGSPDVNTLVLPAVNLTIEPGRCYVNGTLCELESRAPYANQPDGGTAQRLGPGAYLIYLDAWQRHLSSLEAPAIREVALGGPDTATRARTLAQVRALPLPIASPVAWNCDSTIPEWDTLVNPPKPRLAARAEPQLAAANLCDIAATAGYRRLENQLYRVEVHAGGANPSFKWSRENGSVAYAVVGLSINTPAQQTVVRVAARGRDANLDLAAHDRVELIDDDADALWRAGVLLEYLNDGDDELELVLAGVPTGSLGQDPLRHPILRRWDHKPAVAGTHALPIVEGTWIDLEDGVQVRFEPGGTYRPGDYWQIPARTITADVEWPPDNDGDPIAQEPVGVVDAYCRLGIVEVDTQGAVTVASDCRQIFPPLTMLEQLLYVSGDGQDTAPAALLPQPLVVRVARGSVPVAGLTVRFQVDSGGGKVDGSSSQVDVSTDADGLASCRWTLGPAVAASLARFQRVRATLLDADDQALPGQTVVLCATASLTLQYVSGDGQQGTPGTNLPHELELRVANAFDAIVGATVRVTVEQGGGSIVGPALKTSGPDGLVSIAWRLGGVGPQRLRAELIDGSGQVLQRSSFNATTMVPVGSGCDVTIGKGGQFEQLNSSLLEELLAKNDGSICICFLPGVHDLKPLQVTGDGKSRLSVHGCGHASVLNLDGAMQLAGFATLELRDLVIRFRGDFGLLLVKNGEVRLATVDIERANIDAKAQALRIIDAQRVSVIGCTIAGAMPAVAITLQGLSGDCQITQNRFSGIVNFYGDPPGVLNTDQLSKLSSLPNTLKLESVAANLSFCGNTLSMLTVGTNVLSTLANQTARGLFASAVFQGNAFLEQRNVFVANLLAFSANSLLAVPADGSTPYGVMIANRATATGNLAVTVGDEAILQFVTVGNGSFAKAANQVFILP
jgi:photosystem II stability/assembly factor-like uncharacterized protein